MNEETKEQNQCNQTTEIGVQDFFCQYELQMDMIGKAIKKARTARKMTQEELGKLLGVQKAQISRLEKSSNNVTLDTLIRVFRALNAKVVFQVELPEELLDLNNSENSNF